MIGGVGVGGWALTEPSARPSAKAARGFMSMNIVELRQAGDYASHIDGPQPPR